ncbi:MAG: LCP family protein, partial [Oscillospiraceae bacterium]
YGGPELAIKTLNFNFGMDIEDYVTVNFAQLADVIDVVDGATVDLTEDERLAANENMQTIGISNQDIKRGTSGVVRLNGTQAVAYSRIRVIGGDTQRTDRQREVLNSLFSDIKQKKTIEYPGLVKKILPMVVTSLSYTDIIGLAPIMLKGDIPLVQTSFPHKINQAKGQTINGTWYFVYDLEKAQDVLHKFIYEDIHPDDQTE